MYLYAYILTFCRNVKFLKKYISYLVWILVVTLALKHLGSAVGPFSFAYFYTSYSIHFSKNKTFCTFYKKEGKEHQSQANLSASW